MISNESGASVEGLCLVDLIVLAVVLFCCFLKSGLEIRHWFGDKDVLIKVLCFQISKSFFPVLFRISISFPIDKRTRAHVKTK